MGIFALELSDAGASGLAERSKWRGAVKAEGVGKSREYRVIYKFHSAKEDSIIVKNTRYFCV